MSADPLSPFAPARVRALVLPVGRIKRARFLEFHAHLIQNTAVPLQNDQDATSPAIRGGMMFFDFNLSTISDSHSNLAPFELFRESMLVIGIGDASEYTSQDDVSELKESARQRKEQFRDLMDSVRDQYPTMLLHRIFLFDEPGTIERAEPGDDVIVIPQGPECTSYLESCLRRLAVAVCIELNSYSKSIAALPSIISPTVPEAQTLQPQWHTDESPSLSRTSSMAGDRSRSQSPAVDKDLHRMSMPVFPSKNGSDLALSDASGQARNPAKTFEEMGGSPPIRPSPNPVDRLRKRPGSLMPSRDGSKDRVSVHGFGSDSFSEKTRNKGKGRVGVVMASIHLMAGRWDEALRECNESALRARSFSDHMWHAKALELMALSMLLLAWTGLEFPVPPVCYPSTEITTASKNGTNGDLDLRLEITFAPFSTPQAKTTHFKMLSSLLPSMTNLIQSIYSRAASSLSGDVVPQLVFSECTIRLAKLLSVINVSGGLLTSEGLTHLVTGSPLPVFSDLSLTRLGIYPSRREISNILGRALLAPAETMNLSPVDHAMVLAGVASVFSTLGMQRKKAMIMKDFLAVLIPGLLQAKMAGAAEAGIHPSAGLSAIARAGDVPEWELETGVEDVLNVICHVYGIPEAKWTRSVGHEFLQNGLTNGSTYKDKHLPEQLVGNFVLRSFGNINIKADVLRACIQLCEALPDYHGILHYSSTLLRTAGPGIAPSAETSDILVNLSREEQVHLASNIFRTVAEAKAAGRNDIEAEYWDEFLVRGFYLLDSSASIVLRPHKRSDLGKAKAEAPEKRDPFIHNPFLDKQTSTTLPNLLAAGEEREFVVSLQNPYEFEVEIESLRLVAEDIDLDISKHNFFLKPYRTQSFSLIGTIPEEGLVNVYGCFIKVKGCRERLFPVFSEPWTPDADIKVKGIGLFRSSRPDSRPLSEQSLGEAVNERPKRSFPVPATIPLNVIPDQPTLLVSESSIPGSSVMLLEGEKTVVSVTIQNTSSTVPADFLHISFRDTAADAMQDALLQKGISPADMYEIEYQLTKLPALTILPGQPTSIPPNSSATFQFEILAKAGLSSASIQFDYANMSKPHTKDEQSFYTRQVTFPISITVNASILVHRLEIVNLSKDFVWETLQNKLSPEMSSSSTPSTGGRHISHIASTLKELKGADEYCLMLLDLRNNWPSPLQVSLASSQDIAQGSMNSLGEATDSIQPGQISRQLFLLPKIHIADPHRRIKPLSPAHQRQFVVSTGRISPGIEQAARETFWFREALLQGITGHWSETLDGSSKSGRSGLIDLRSIRLSPRMVNTLRLPDVSFSFSALGNTVSQVGERTFQISTDEFVTLRIVLRNRSPQKVYAMLRLRPSLADQPREIALDISKRLAWTGALQRPVAVLQPGGVQMVELPIRALCAGEFEIGASVEETKPAEDEVRAGDDDEEKEMELDDLVTARGRRVWTAVEPCRLAAIDSEEVV
ncbi:Trs120-domain-containing protein [Microthyrium microscopicum]|uniref:Trs120-domain-containing protein n=1 Tax=Microthyrium microscopicum TaxID=703497 RepID=A0A6A6UKE7_9PEZI|nr:Trs120-domain-containing protein [Microthyrium microscopicum]